VKGSVSYEELDRLAGEVLPERVVLSTVAPAGPSSVSAGGQSCTVTYNPGTPGLVGSLGLGSSNPGATMVCASAGGVCQVTYSAGTPGLLGSLGLGSSNPGATAACIPAPRYA
jgi:hypothetical protein